jgi:hypothetical protein
VRDEEAHVGRSLVAHLGGTQRVQFEEGQDPPDLVLVLEGSRIGVEVTRLSQFTVHPDGTLGNRATDDSFGMRVVDELDVKLGPLLPEHLDLFIHLKMPAQSGGKFKSKLAAWVRQVVSAPTLGMEEERRIEGADVRISAVVRRRSTKRIVGLVGNENSSPDVGLNARLLLEDRIATKHEICKGLAGPIWLALLNDYWLADADSYQLAMRKLTMQHCFERIFLVRADGCVSELRR